MARALCEFHMARALCEFHMARALCEFHMARALCEFHMARALCEFHSDELDMHAATREKRHSTFHSRCFSPRPQAGCCSQSAPRRSSGEQLLMQMVFASVVASVGSCHSNNDSPPHSPHGCLCAVSGSQLTATQSQHGQATHAQPPH
jgi:hypothetical protein